MITVRVLALLTVAMVVAPRAALADFVLISQYRSTSAEAAACGKFVILGETAPDFGPFDESVEVTQSCDPISALASAAQTSTVGSTLFHASGEATAETVIDGFDQLQVVATSNYGVDFEVVESLRVRFSGAMSSSATSPALPSWWSAAWVDLRRGNDSIFTHTVFPELNGPPVEETVDAVRRLDPGIYVYWLGGSALVTDSFPATGNFRGAYDVTMQAFHIADLNLDGHVAFNDLLILLAEWGPCVACRGDIDGDGEVGFNDLLALLAAWGTPVP